MSNYLKKPIFIFVIGFLIVSLPLCIFPINLFQGEIIYVQGLQEVKVQAPLSLSYFIGLGYEESDMTGVKDFYLLPSGYVLAFIFTVGFPALFAYRIYLKQNKAEKKNQ